MYVSHWNEGFQSQLIGYGKGNDWAMVKWQCMLGKLHMYVKNYSKEKHKKCMTIQYLKSEVNGGISFLLLPCCIIQILKKVW